MTFGSSHWEVSKNRRFEKSEFHCIYKVVPLELFLVKFSRNFRGCFRRR